MSGHKEVPKNILEDVVVEEPRKRMRVVEVGVKSSTWRDEMPVRRHKSSEAVFEAEPHKSSQKFVEALASKIVCVARATSMQSVASATR
jgi:hypothetical protein